MNDNRNFWTMILGLAFALLVEWSPFLIGAAVAAGILAIAMLVL